MTNLLIVGYHGFGNCGDEAILLAMKNNILKLNKDVAITALSYNPEATKKLYNINSVQRFNIVSVFVAIVKSDIVLSGGGTLLQDETSTRSLLYYLSIIFLAKFLGKKVMLYSNGIGPVKHIPNKRLIKSIINKVDVITLRDKYSEEELRSLGVKIPQIYTTADPAFSLLPISKDESKKILINENIPLDKPIIGISIRKWKNYDDFIQKTAELSDYILENYDVNILLIPMQLPKDLVVSNDLKLKIKSEKVYVLSKSYNSTEIMGIIGELHLLISMRLHSLIFAAVQNVPLAGIVYDPKIQNYLNLLDMPTLGNVEDSLIFEDMKNVIDDILKNYDDYYIKLKNSSTLLKEKVKLNDIYLEKLIDK